jgi:hypothetical protein
MVADLILPTAADITSVVFDSALTERKDAHLASLADLPAEIVDADTCQAWRTASTAGAKLIKAVEQARKAVTSKVDTFKKSVMEVERQFVKDLEDADRILSTGLLDYDAKVRAEEARRQAILMAEQRKAVESGRQSIDLAAASQVVVPEPVAAGKPATRDIRRPVIVDEGAIPREFMTPDLKKIQAAVDAGLVIPGVTFTTETILIRR